MFFELSIDSDVFHVPLLTTWEFNGTWLRKKNISGPKNLILSVISYNLVERIYKRTDWTNELIPVTICLFSDSGVSIHSTNGMFRMFLLSFVVYQFVSV